MLVTNKLLHYMKIMEYSHCKFCTQQEENTYIYCLRCNKQPPMIEVFKKMLYFMYKLQTECENDTIEAFLKECNPYQPLLNNINI